MKYNVGDMFLNFNAAQHVTYRCGIMIESLQSAASYCIIWFPPSAAVYRTHHNLLSIELNIKNKHWKHYPVKA